MPFDIFHLGPLVQVKRITRNYLAIFSLASLMIGVYVTHFLVPILCGVNDNCRKTFEIYQGMLPKFFIGRDASPSSLALSTPMVLCQKYHVQ